MSNDLKGYYARLGLEPDATDTDIKSAFRKLAKEHHPDSGNVTDGGARFRALREAYAILSDGETRAAYNSLSATTEATASRQSGRRIEPISCESCRKITAQPRFVVYRHVVSFVLGTVRTPVQGIFCAECANSKGLKATAISAIAGWWGVPWGPLYTLSEGLRNAFGGSSDIVNNERLLWHNALAFGMNGQSRLSLALADKLRGARDRDIAAGAAKLIEHFRVQGIELGLASLKDPWLTSPGRVAIHLLLVAALPAAIATIAYGTSEQSTTITPTSYAATSGSLPTMDSRVEAPTQMPDEPLPKITIQTCKRVPANGKVLAGGKRLLTKGHLLEIANGSSGDAIVKLRDATSLKSFASFFIKSGESASLTGIPDGSYAIQYAFGPSLAADCKSFATIDSAGQFPEVETLNTERTEDYFGTNIRRMRLSYTLYSVPGGNVRPESIPAGAFNSE